MPVEALPSVARTGLRVAQLALRSECGDPEVGSGLITATKIANKLADALPEPVLKSVH